MKIDLAGGDRPRVFDPIRGRWVALTPEEWVRQHFTAFLIGSRDYPRSLIANEVAINLGGMSRRCDTVVYRRDGATPLAIVEYKAPTVAVTAAVFRQAARYNIVMRAPLLIVSNGLRHHCAIVTPNAPTPRFLSDIPSYGALEGFSDDPSRGTSSRESR